MHKFLYLTWNHDCLWLQTSCHRVISSSLCHSTETTDTLIDLAGLDTPSPPQPAPPPFQSSNLVSTNPTASAIPVLPPPPKRLAGSHGSQSSSPSHPPLDKASTALSLLDDELLSLGSTSPVWLAEFKERFPTPPKKYAIEVLKIVYLSHLLLGLNDPPTSLSTQSKPKLNELSGQWTSLQVHLK